MRVTNTMITNNSMYHVGNAKKKVMTANTQYTTQKKILRPSDDPIIAVRSLKYRTNLSEVTQYVDKNIPDAKAWLEMTETALDNTSNILENMVYYCNQGANDTLTAQDRDDVMATLQQFVEDIYMQEANTDYNGRFVFTGFRTDTSMIFEKTEKSLCYNIIEEFDATDIEKRNIVLGGTKYDASYTTGQQYVDESAKMDSIFGIRLAYDDLCNSPMEIAADGTVTLPSGTATDYVSLNYTYTDATGNEGSGTYAAVTRISTEEDAYVVGEDEVVFMYDTGEILMGSNVQSNLSTLEAKMSVEYTKNQFVGSDIRPEHYFECDSYNTVTSRLIDYNNPEGQDIEYDINFSQSLKVNTQGRDAISTDIQRVYDYIRTTVDAVENVERKIAEAEKAIRATTDKDELKTLDTLKETLEKEKNLCTQVMQEAFGRGITMIHDAQQLISNATSDLGARYSRLQLTYNKMLDNQDQFEEMLSENEDIDLAEAFTNLSVADSLYNASLSATAKILGNTLLDYIR